MFGGVAPHPMRRTDLLPWRNRRTPDQPHATAPCSAATTFCTTHLFHHTRQCGASAGSTVLFFNSHRLLNQLLGLNIMLWLITGSFITVLDGVGYKNFQANNPNCCMVQYDTFSATFPKCRIVYCGNLHKYFVQFESVLLLNCKLFPCPWYSFTLAHKVWNIHRQ